MPALHIQDAVKTYANGFTALRGVLNQKLGFHHAFTRGHGRAEVAVKAHHGF